VVALGAEQLLKAVVGARQARHGAAVEQPGTVAAGDLGKVVDGGRQRTGQAAMPAHGRDQPIEAAPDHASPLAPIVAQHPRCRVHPGVGALHVRPQRRRALQAAADQLAQPHQWRRKPPFASKWSYFYLYVVLDIPSRRVVGWQVADAESAALFKPLLDDAIAKHQVPPGQLTLHADRGGPMKAKATALLLADLGVTKSHSRPHTSNDNPFSEAHFKTLKYQPAFPRRFGCIEDAKAFCRAFFAWYNQDHHHAGLGLMTPDQVHYGQADAVHAARQQTLDRAFAEHPERFVKKPPTPPNKPVAAWINITLLRLPPYAPELNPMENVWEYLRGTPAQHDRVAHLHRHPRRLLQRLEQPHDRRQTYHIYHHPRLGTGQCLGGLVLLAHPDPKRQHGKCGRTLAGWPARHLFVESLRRQCASALLGQPHRGDAAEPEDRKGGEVEPDRHRGAVGRHQPSCHERCKAAADRPADMSAD